MMNGFILKENKNFKEKYYYKELASGFKITVIPKDLPTNTAFLCCDFGGADVEYTMDGKNYSLPYGTAHFLEHKMFENADGSDAFSNFDNFGGSANAFTSYENTCYYFSCTDNFFENLDVLLNSVSSLHCTEKSVKKEEKIIAREITMYEDLPNSNVSRNLCKAMYHLHPTIEPISGTIESISHITKDVLYQAYNHFYVPSNLSLCVCGNMDMEKISDYAERYFGKASQKRPETIFHDEDISVSQKNITQEGVVATSLFSIGIKCPPYDENNLEAVRKSSAMRLAISLIFGRASDFYCENYAKGLLNERFYAGFTTCRHAAHIIISASGDQPELVMEKALAEIRHRQKVFFTDEQILREKKAAYAESLTLFDSGEDLASSCAASAFLNYDEFDCIEIIRDVTNEEIRAALLSIDTSNSAISIIKKGKEQ